MVKQNDLTEYVAQHYSNAETVGKVGEDAFFVPQMIVGEKALVKVNYAKKGVAYADVVQLLQTSPLRQKPPCKHFGKCGGCALMHMQYAEQLVFKQQKVQNNLKKIGGLNVEVLPCVPSAKVLGYRNKLSLPVRGKVGNVQIGMYQKGSHNVVDVQDCLLGDSWSATLVAIFRKYLNENRIVPYNEKTFSGQVRHLVARFVDNQLLVTVVSNGKWKADLQPFAKALQAHFSKFGLFVNENNLKNNVILGENTQYVCGLRHIEGQHLGVKFHLQPDSFFQVNNEIKDGLYKKVQELLNLSETQVLVDCFSGVGILTNVLASKNFQTYAVEIAPQAVQDAQEIARLNNTPNVTNVCGDVNVELPKITAQNSGKVMTLVVDPPRKGLGENLCNTILSANFNHVVYVSCDSATLARDLAQLSQAYDVTYVQPWDMFPNTAEVETLVALSRKRTGV
ncbi:MAG: 23S rRNA (uracil(1939)-C(5))-methyltransferase RlmD [Candidatus Fimimonas sp.]